MLRFLAERRLNQVDALTIAFGSHALAEQSWFLVVGIFVVGVGLSIFAEHQLAKRHG